MVAVSHYRLPPTSVGGVLGLSSQPQFCTRANPLNQPRQEIILDVSYLLVQNWGWAITRNGKLYQV